MLTYSPLTSTQLSMHAFDELSFCSNWIVQRCTRVFEDMSFNFFGIRLTTTYQLLTFVVSGAPLRITAEYKSSFLNTRRKVRGSLNASQEKYGKNNPPCNVENPRATESNRTSPVSRYQTTLFIDCVQILTTQDTILVCVVTIKDMPQKIGTINVIRSDTFVRDKDEDESSERVMTDDLSSTCFSSNFDLSKKATDQSQEIDASEGTKFNQRMTRAQIVQHAVYPTVR